MNVYILLDRSGSMSSMWSEALGSINGYVKELEPSTKVLLAVFDTNSYDVLRVSTAADWKPVTNDDATPRGGTPLFDASARMMWRIQDDNPERAVFLVMTDGEENNSKYFKQADVKALTSKLEAKKYEVIFLGANFDKVGDIAVQQYGRGIDKFANINKGNAMDFMTTRLATSTRAYGATGQAMSFSGEDKAAAAGGYAVDVNVHVKK